MSSGNIYFLIVLTHWYRLQESLGKAVNSASEMAVAQRNHQLLPTSIFPTFTCQDSYKLRATLNVTESNSKILPVTAYSLICVSTYENLFCTKTTDDDWKRGQCFVGDSEIECPLFQTYETYSEFMLWKITTFIVKIGYTINGKEYNTIYRPIAPYFKCTDIAKIGPKDKMFLNSNHKKDGRDCS